MDQNQADNFAGFYSAKIPRRHRSAFRFSRSETFVPRHSGRSARRPSRTRTASMPGSLLQSAVVALESARRAGIQESNPSVFGDAWIPALRARLLEKPAGRTKIPGRVRKTVAWKTPRAPAGMTELPRFRVKFEWTGKPDLWKGTKPGECFDMEKSKFSSPQEKPGMEPGDAAGVLVPTLQRGGTGTPIENYAVASKKVTLRSLLTPYPMDSLSRPTDSPS